MVVRYFGRNIIKLNEFQEDTFFHIYIEGVFPETLLSLDESVVSNLWQRLVLF